MSSAGLSIFVFGLYLLVLAGPGFVFMPNKLLAMLKQPRTEEPWIRILGFVILLLGIYYITAARNELVPLFVISIYARYSVLIFFIIMSLIKKAAPVLIGFGIVDALGATWTLLAL